MRDSRRNISPLDKTKEVLQTVLDSLTPDLRFTLESQQDYPDKHCPTLDFNLRIGKVNGRMKNTFKFYEKPTATPYTILNSSAMSQQDKASTLSQEACRRLDRKSEDRSMGDKPEALNRFNQRLILSGYNLKMRREIIKSGIRVHKRELLNPVQGQIHIYRNMDDIQSRRVNKASEKTIWMNKIMFRNRNNDHSKKKKDKNSKQMGGGPKWVDGVFLAPRTTDGTLCRMLRTAEMEIRKICSSSVKIIEEPRRQIRKILRSDPWKIPCPRANCRPCRYPENKVKCNTRGIIYQSTCVKCKEVGISTI